MPITALHNSKSLNKVSGKRFYKKGFIGDIVKNPYSYLLILPAFIYTFIFSYATMPYMLIAFKKFNYGKGLFASEWVGLKNFNFFFKSSDMWIVTRNTIFLNALFILATTTVAIFVAVALNEIKGRIFLKITQSAFVFPTFLSWIVVSYIIYSFFSTQNGIINRTFVSLGMDTVNWYSTPEYWPGILTFTKVWKEAGLASVIYVATLASFDQGLYEAASIDGAEKWKQIRYITLPLLFPTVTIMTLLAIGRIFNADFGMIYALVGDNGLLFPTTDVIDTYVFRALRKVGNPSNAMAIGIVQSTLSFVLVMGANWIAKKRYPDGALY